LNISSRAGIEDNVAMHAAGFLEGALTQALIWEFNNATNANFPCSDETIAFLEKNLAWTEAQIEAYRNDPYWLQVSLVLEQLWGMVWKW
jgi:hypothetical protein